MANNKISQWIEAAMHTPADMQLAMHIGKGGFDYAAKLDRLVQAARKVCEDTDLYFSDAPITCGYIEQLTAALKAIELPIDRPGPPWRVLAITSRPSIYIRDPLWWEWDEDCEAFYSCGKCHESNPNELTVVDDSRNDPEAAEIIRKASSDRN